MIYIMLLQDPLLWVTMIFIIITISFLFMMTTSSTIGPLPMWDLPKTIEIEKHTSIVVCLITSLPKENNL